jgi:hypothetical protein
VVTVGGIADEAGAGVGEVFDCWHGNGDAVRGSGREARRQWGVGLGLRREGGGAYGEGRFRRLRDAECAADRMRTRSHP